MYTLSFYLDYHSSIKIEVFWYQLSGLHKGKVWTKLKQNYDPCIEFIDKN